MLDGRLQLFLSELQQQCRQYGSAEFTFEREYWDPFWQPWFIYVQEHALQFTAVDIAEKDLAILVELGYIRQLEAIVPSIDASDVKSGRFCLSL